MRTTILPSGRTALHNGDFSGDVEIRQYDKNYDYASVTLPFEDLVALVAECVRDKAIAALEQADPHEILGMVRDG